MPSIEPVNETTLKLHFDHQQVKTSSEKIAALMDALSAYSECIVDFIPAYTTLTIVLDLNKTQLDSFQQIVVQALANISVIKNKADAKHHTLPCYYGLDAGWDLAELATHLHLSVDNIIERHSQAIYRVYALGFSPGFPYLGFVEPSIATPRRSNPRTFVPRGSVGIAENQTGIYPQSSPGGWNIIGCCPAALFSLKHNPSKLAVGDSVSFRAISKKEFLSLGGTISASEASHVR